MMKSRSEPRWKRNFSALQRAEIAEIDIETQPLFRYPNFSALQRAEIAEMRMWYRKK